MKKLLVVLMVLAFVAPAMAEDMLDLSGTMRVRAWDTSNLGDFDTDTDSDHNQYWDQRLRIMGVITPADGVKAVFRMDYAEDKWGSDNWEGSRYSSDSEIQVDRAYLDVTKGMFNIVAGEAYFGLGNAYAYDNNQTGVAVTLKTPVTVRVGYLKIDEDQTNSGNLTDEDTYEDLDHYIFDVGYKADTFGVNVFYAMQNDGLTTSDEPTLLGAMGTFSIGPVDVMAELDMFGGDNGAGVDYVGTQFYADASMKFSDALTAGLQLIYSDGNDSADERKIVRMPNAFFGSQYYSDYGPFATDIVPLGDGDVFDPLGSDSGSIYSSGAMGGGLYASFKPMEALTLSGQFLYLTGVEDSTDGMFDKGYVIGVGADYMLVQNANLALEYLYADVDKINEDTDSGNALVARIQVAF